MDIKSSKHEVVFSQLCTTLSHNQSGGKTQAKVSIIRQDVF